MLSWSLCRHFLFQMVFTTVRPCEAALTKMPSSGPDRRDSPLKVKKGWIWQSVGQHFHYLVHHFEFSLVYAKTLLMDHKITFLNWEMKWGKSLYDKYFFKRELNFKNSQFLRYTIWSANHFLGTINKFYEIRKTTLQYIKNL